MAPFSLVTALATQPVPSVQAGVSYREARGFERLISHKPLGAPARLVYLFAHMSDSESNHSDKEMSEAEEEAHELVGGDDSGAEDSGAEEPPAPSAKESAEKLEASATLFLPYNKGYYKVVKHREGRAGWLRCYNRKVPVSSGKMLGEMMANHKVWPKGEELKKLVSADKIVVVNGKFCEKEKGADTKRATEDCNIWYVLFEVDGAMGKHDEKILRHIPKPVYKELLESIKKDPTMAESSLLRMYAFNDNEKSFNPEDNGMNKATGSETPKTALLAPKKEEKPPKPKDDPTPKPSEKEEKSAEKKSSKASKELKEPKEPAKDVENEDAKKPSMESFWKPRLVADAPSEEPKKGPREEGGKEASATGNKRAAEAPPAKESNGKALFKRRRTSVIEEHDFLISGASVKVDFPAPEGATGGKATITWSFE